MKPLSIKVDQCIEIFSREPGFLQNLSCFLGMQRFKPEFLNTIMLFDEPCSSATKVTFSVIKDYPIHT